MHLSEMHYRRKHALYTLESVFNPIFCMCIFVQKLSKLLPSTCQECKNSVSATSPFILLVSFPFEPVLMAK